LPLSRVVAIVILLLVRKVNAMRSKLMPPAPNTKDCPYCKEYSSGGCVGLALHIGSEGVKKISEFFSVQTKVRF
jgi:hypothetical protein